MPFGTATLSSNSSALTVSLNLSYSAQVGANGIFQLTAQGTESSSGYSLSLEGSYKWNGTDTLTFSFGYNSNSKQMTIGFAYSDPNLKAAVNIIANSAGVSITISFTIQVALTPTGWQLTPISTGASTGSGSAKPAVASP